MSADLGRFFPPQDSTGRPLRVGDRVRYLGHEYRIVSFDERNWVVLCGPGPLECLHDAVPGAWLDLIEPHEPPPEPEPAVPLGVPAATPWRIEVPPCMGITLHPAQTAVFRIPKYRCGKGHVFEGQLLWHVGDGSGRSFPICPGCYAALIERECGGPFEEVPADGAG